MKLAFFFVALAGCGDSQTIYDPVPIEVGLQFATGAEERCDSAFGGARSVAVELHQPLGDPDAPIGRCVLERSCIEVAHESLSSLEDLEVALAEHDPYFEGLPEYEDVQLHIRGTPFSACQFSPVEDPIFCGLSNYATIASPQAQFTVAISCGVDPCPPLAVPCAGSDL